MIVSVGEVAEVGSEVSDTATFCGFLLPGRVLKITVFVRCKSMQKSAHNTYFV